jgi:hypothetical protein
MWKQIGGGLFAPNFSLICNPAFESGVIKILDKRENEFVACEISM